VCIGNRGGSVKPLSLLYYINNNKRKVIPTFISICFAVFLVYFLSMAVKQINNSYYNQAAKNLEYYTGVTPMNGQIPNDILEQIKSSKYYKKIIPYNKETTLVNTIVGGLPVDIVYTDDTDLDMMLNTMELKIVSGRKPSVGKHEIILHKNIVKNKGLKIGSQIGSELDKDEGIKGRYTLVGIIDGPCQVGFGLLEENRRAFDEAIKYGLAIIPKDNSLKELNNSLDSLPMDDVDIYCFKHAIEGVKSTEKVLNILAVIVGLIVAIVLCIILFNINYMNYYKRRKEFGLLSSIGYKKNQIIKRIFIENIFIAMTAYSFGILVSIFCGWLLNTILWIPKGDEMPIWIPVNIIVVLILPLIVTIFSVIPAAGTLKKLDVITIIEGI
jgi:putative ABC transport system permease protein